MEVCITASRETLKRIAGLCPLLLLSFFLILLRGQSTTTLAGVQEVFLCQGTSDQRQWVNEGNQAESLTIMELLYQGLSQSSFCRGKN